VTATGAPSTSSDTTDTTAGTRPWWRDAVVYQIYPRSFADANGDGVGDLRGIVERLDHLERLGVDAVWLSPIFRSPMRDFGYDVSDYCAIDPLFGTDEDFDALVDGLHRRGMRLLLDWVPNHTSDQHPWFAESRASRTSAKRDWYLWRDGREDGSPPNNWRAVFKGAPAWTFDEATGQYWFHFFLPEQPDLNWANPEVEAAMHDTLRYWLDRGVDGFRADVVHLIGKGTELPDLPPEQARAAMILVDEPFTHELLRRIRTLLDAYRHQPMMVGEVYLLGEGQAATYLGDDDELHLTFDFRAVHTPWEPGPMRAAIEAAQREFADPRWPTWVLSNHDQPRQRTRIGREAGARAAAVLSTTMRATPYLYAGEELGLENAEVPEELRTDPDGRDGCRAPIPWTRDDGHGWGPSPWLPFPPDPAGRSAEAQDGDPASMLELYRALLRLRRERPALRAGSLTLLDADPRLVAYERRAGDDRVVVVVNLTEEVVPLGAELLGRATRLVRSSDPGRHDGPVPEQLFGDEAVILDA
jgi:alpha-glucosidase